MSVGTLWATEPEKAVIFAYLIQAQCFLNPKPIFRTRTTIPSHFLSFTALNFVFSPATTNKVASVLSSVQDRQSRGTDNKSNKILIILQKILISYFCHQRFFQTAIFSAIVPSCDNYLHLDSCKDSTASLQLSANHSTSLSQ